MAVLDCETFDSALRSSAEILNVRPEDLRNLLAAFECSRESVEWDYPELVAKQVLGSDPQLPDPSAVCWFHATRAFLDSTFSQQGILPLASVLERIWEALGQLALQWCTLEQWRAFRKERIWQTGRPAYGYRIRIESPVNAGPFAFLVRDFIFKPGLARNHDYFGTPEIVEQICWAFEECFHFPLQQKFKEATRPCIVKFRSTRPHSEKLLRVALAYLHCTLRGYPLFIDCNTCFDGKGDLVPANDVLSVEWIN